MENDFELNLDRAFTFPPIPSIAYCLAGGHRWSDDVPGITGRVCIRCGLHPAQVDEHGYPLEDKPEEETPTAPNERLQLLARLAGWGYFVGGEGLDDLVAEGLATRCEPDPGQYATPTAKGYQELALLATIRALALSPEEDTDDNSTE